MAVGGVVEGRGRHTSEGGRGGRFGMEAEVPCRCCGRAASPADRLIRSLVGEWPSDESSISFPLVLLQALPSLSLSQTAWPRCPRCVRTAAITKPPVPSNIS
jgi:hypothetical protein